MRNFFKKEFHGFFIMIGLILFFLGTIMVFEFYPWDYNVFKKFSLFEYYVIIFLFFITSLLFIITGLLFKKTYFKDNE
jgi:hypothetical protein